MMRRIFRPKGDEVTGEWRKPCVFDINNMDNQPAGGRQHRGCIIPQAVTHSSAPEDG